jgi:hypothetical protein
MARAAAAAIPQEANMVAKIQEQLKNPLVLANASLRDQGEQLIEK